MPVLVDSNVLLDVITDDRAWADWSRDQLGRAIDTSTVVINAVVYAEVSAGFDTIEDVDTALPGTLYRREEIPHEAAFLAGKAFLAYRRRGGVRRSSLPDFFIGAHASVAGYRLLTRDVSRFRTYFPRLRLIAPDTMP